MTAGKAKLIAALWGLPVPVLGGACLFWFYSSDVELGRDWWWYALMTLPLVFGSAVGVIRCGMTPSVVGFLSTIGCLLYGGFPLLGVCVIGAAALIIGADIAEQKWRSLRRQVAEQCESEESLHARNPRCAGCRIKSGCPLKPGGLADQYKGIEVVPAVPKS